MQSRWYSTSLVRPPRWLSYRLETRIAGQTVVFTDDPTDAFPAALPGQPVQLFLQGADLDPSGQSAITTGPWRTTTDALDADRADGVRFLLLFDRSVRSDVEVTDLSIHYEH